MLRINRRVPTWDSITVSILCACLAYLMLRPVGFNTVLLPVLAVLAVVSLPRAVFARSTVTRPLVIVLSIVIGLGLYGTLIGLGNPGVVNGALVWIVAPIIFGVWAASGDRRLVGSVLRTSAIVTILASTVVILYVAGELKTVPQVIPHWLQVQGGLGFDHRLVGRVAINYYGLSTLVASAPMWLTAAVLPSHPWLPRRGLSIAAASTALVVSLIAGRAALTVVAIVIPAAAWVAWRIVTRNAVRARWRTLAPVGVAILGVAFVSVLALAGNSNVKNTMDRVISLFTGANQNGDDQTRAIEAGKLLNAWAQSPIFGHGLGATINGYSRSTRGRPWNFELQYHLILFQFGLLGALLLLVALGIVLFGVVRVVRREPELLVLYLVVGSGAVSMLVANASNPYLQAPGNMWPIYLFLMVLNVNLLSQRQVTPTLEKEVLSTT